MSTGSRQLTLPSLINSAIFSAISSLHLPLPLTNSLPLSTRFSLNLVKLFPGLCSVRKRRKSCVPHDSEMGLKEAEDKEEEAAWIKVRSSEVVLMVGEFSMREQRALMAAIGMARFCTQLVSVSKLSHLYALDIHHQTARASYNGRQCRRRRKSHQTEYLSCWTQAGFGLR